MPGGHVIIKPRSIIRRGMKRIIEDLSEYVTDPDVHDICNKHVDDWTDMEELTVQVQIDALKSE